MVLGMGGVVRDGWYISRSKFVDSCASSEGTPVGGSRLYIRGRSTPTPGYARAYPVIPCGSVKNFVKGFTKNAYLVEISRSCLILLLVPCVLSHGVEVALRVACLIEVTADKDLKESVTMGIPLPKGAGFTKETVQVEYEWKPPCCVQCQIFGHVYDQCPKNVTVSSTVDQIRNDGFQSVVIKKKSGKTGSTINHSGVAVSKAAWQPIKSNVTFEPKNHGNMQKH
nr:hypothetical protein [Tanacetum cinerariifolium]